MLVIHVVFYVTDFSSRKIRCKFTTIFWNMQGLDEKNRILLRFFWYIGLWGLVQVHDGFTIRKEERTLVREKRISKDRHTILLQSAINAYSCHI